jgi:hypothetical protein
VVDPLTAEAKIRKDLPYPDLPGVLTTAGGLVVTAILDGTILVYDDQKLEKLSETDVGTSFVAPSMTYAVNGRQYIAIASGIGPVGKAKIARGYHGKNQSIILNTAVGSAYVTRNMLINRGNFESQQTAEQIRLAATVSIYPPERARASPFIDLNQSSGPMA